MNFQEKYPEHYRAFKKLNNEYYEAARSLRVMHRDYYKEERRVDLLREQVRAFRAIMNTLMAEERD